MAVILVILVILVIADNEVMVILVIEILALIVVIRDLQIRGRGRDISFSRIVKKYTPRKASFYFFYTRKINTFILIEGG